MGRWIARSNLLPPHLVQQSQCQFSSVVMGRKTFHRTVEIHLSDSGDDGSADTRITGKRYSIRRQFGKGHHLHQSSQRVPAKGSGFLLGSTVSPVLVALR